MSNKVTVVTSCSAVGWQQYGERFVHSFNKYWPDDVDLHIVSEDKLEWKPSKPPKRTIILWPLHSSTKANSFLTRHDPHAWVRGDAGDPNRPAGVAAHWRPNSGKHCFRHDAYKFCKKVFAIELIADFVKEGKLFWIDSDVVTFAPVPASLFESTLPRGYALSCLARQGYHSECGYVGYNLDDPAATKFITAFADLYSSDEVFQLAEWHDSWVFDWLRNKLLTSTWNIPHKSKSHPFINSDLGLYMDHLKGNRKKQGRSYKVEQIKHKNVDYWRA